MEKEAIEFINKDYENRGFSLDDFDVVTNEQCVRYMVEFTNLKLNLLNSCQLLLCKRTLWYKTLTEGKTYTLIFENNQRCFIKDDSGTITDYSSKHFEVIAQ